MDPFYKEADPLLDSLCRTPSPLERLRGEDPRRDVITHIVATGDPRFVAVLLPVLANDDPLSAEAARAIAALMTHVTPTQLAWVDEQARHYAFTFRQGLQSWWKLSPSAVNRIAQVSGSQTAVIGVLSSHPNGHVREAAVKVLGRRFDGLELPFLVLRANDWVGPIAALAGEFLSERLVPEYRDAVLRALPFIVRMLGQRRQDLGRFSSGLRNLLTADDLRDVLARIPTRGTSERRVLYDLLWSKADATSAQVIQAASADADDVIRQRAVIRLSATAQVVELLATVEELAVSDPAPIVRTQALSVVANAAPARALQLLPRVLFDRAVSVRELARYFVRSLDAPMRPRELYVESLTSTSTRRLAVAIEGLGETGTAADVDLCIGFAMSAAPRVRRATLRALARLGPDRAISLALDALADPSSSVRGLAVRILAAHARRLDFDRVRPRLQELSDPRTRQRSLRVLSGAPKWDAAVFLLEATADSDGDVRREASRLLDLWVDRFNDSQASAKPEQLQRIAALLDINASRISTDAAELLRFSLKP